MLYFSSVLKILMHIEEKKHIEWQMPYAVPVVIIVGHQLVYIVFGITMDLC